MPSDDLENSPPLHPRALLQQWVDDFRAHGYLIAGSVHVAEQDGSDGRDTGLVVVQLHGKNVSIYMEPTGYDQPLWQATLTARPEEQTFGVADLAHLAAELVVAGNLCAYLQYRSLEWDRESGRRA
ncbi:MAG: hypothetical protein PIR02_15825 [Microbacterium enclense]